MFEQGLGPDGLATLHLRRSDPFVNEEDMSDVLERLSTYFTPEERRRGEDLVSKDQVVISSASDTDVKGFVKGSGACRVTLAAPEVASSSFAAEGTCTVARKGRLCRHVWGVLVALESKSSDFLEGKQEIGEPSPVAESAKKSEYKERQKLRAKEFRHAMKERDKKAKGKEREPAFHYPAAVEEARQYFQTNGFPLENLNLEEINNAKRILSRVFHPDRGGTSEEILTLNHNFDILREYLT